MTLFYVKPGTFLHYTMKAAVGIFVLLYISSAYAALVESERLIEHERRNYTYPFPSLTPNTEGMHKIMDMRFKQIEQMSESGARYEGFIQTVNAAVLAPNFTENGWGLTRAPEDLMVDLRAGIRDGLDTATPEGPIEVIGGQVPLFIRRPDLTKRVLEELKPILEAWSKTKLTPYRAYGFRLYQNQSNLMMHVDKLQTHIISCILHIDSSEDSEPWPILIEDYQGNTQEVVLKSGEVLLYESSKCFHGRPSKFNGSWYSSIFVHYYPASGWKDVDHKLEAHYAVPPVWNKRAPATKALPKLEMVGTSMKEPECPNEWCASSDTVTWPDNEDRSTYGQVLTTGGKTFSLNLGDDDGVASAGARSEL